MLKERKHRAEEKLKVVEACLSGKVGVCEAGRRAGVDESSVRQWISRYKAEGPSAFMPTEHYRKYPAELKRRAVEEYQGGKGSLQDICEKYRIRSKRQLMNWIKVYNRHEDFKTQSGGSHMTKARKTSQEERQKIVRECIENGKNYGETAQKYNVSYQQVYTWVKKFRELGEAGLEDRRGQRTAQQAPRTKEEELKARIAQLEQENYMLKMERDLLKKVKELERRDRWGK
ncbi:MAG: helix-turn-helix domain-containing protein [Faecousia sp.]